MRPQHPTAHREPTVPDHPSIPPAKPCVLSTDSGDLRRKAARLAVVVVSLLLLAAVRAPESVAQEPMQAGAGLEEGPPALAAGQVEVSILAGALAPVSRLTEEAETFSTELATSGLFAADAVYWLHDRYGVAARVGYAPATVAVVPGNIAGAVPEDLGPADYLILSAEGRIRFAPPGRGISLVPYLAAGGGVRVLGVRALAGPEVEDSTDPMASVAAGATMPLLRPVDLRLELRDHVTFYETPAGENRLQHDLGILLGASVRIR